MRLAGDRHERVAPRLPAHLVPADDLADEPLGGGRVEVGGKVGGPRAHGRPRVDLAEPRHELRHAQALVAAEEVPHRRLVAPPVAVLAHDL